MTSVILKVTPYQTSLECIWDIVDISLNKLTSAVMTYTDVSNNDWFNHNISNTGRFTQSTTIYGLGSDITYRVFLTTRYSRPDHSSFTVISNVVTKTTTDVPDQPIIRLLAGSSYIQVLFTDPSGAAYDFSANDVTSIVVSYNKLQNNGTASSHASATADAGAKFYYVDNGLNSDLKTYTFTSGDISSNSTQVTYKYILISGLHDDTDYEVASTYYTSDGLGAGPVSLTHDIKTLPLRSDTGYDSKEFISYALNDASNNVVDRMVALGESTPKINVSWLDPFEVTGDIIADLPTEPNSIIREEWYDPSGNWFNSAPNWVFADPSYSTIDISGNGAYSKTGSTYTYVDTNLVAGHKYRYTIVASSTDLDDSDRDINITSTTNEVVAVTETAIALDNEDFVLDPSNGSIWLQSDFSSIITNTGGFPQDANGVYQLEYKFVNDASYTIIPIFTTSNNELMTNQILRTSGQELLEYATITLIPNMTTTYLDSWTIEKEQIIYYENSVAASNTTSPTTNYNTTFPLEVTNFAYVNTTDVSTAASNFELTWNDDDTTNPNNDQYYRVIATDASSATFTIILSKLDVSGNVLADVSGNIYDAITGGSYIIDASTDAFFATGSSYNFSIQRGYISTNTITNSSYTDLVVLAEGGTNNLFYGPISGPFATLTMFNNPPAPTVSNYTFNEATAVLAFDMSYNIGVSDTATEYGFLQSDTRFRVTVSPAANNNANYTFDAFSFDGISGNQLYTVDMSGVAVGASCDLTVEEYVTTDYNSVSNSASFYSVVTSLSFVREGPLAAPASVISYNSTGFTPLNENMQIEWSEVSDNAATSLSAAIYYEMIVTDISGGVSSDTPNLFLLVNTTMTDYFDPSIPLISDDVNTIQLDANGAPIYTVSPLPFFADTSNAYVTYTNSNSLLSVAINNLTIGNAYSYKIRQVYYDSIFEKYVYSPYTSTNTSLISFILPPVPIVFMDVENVNDDISGNDQLGVTMEYNPVNNCGFQNADISFAYMNNASPSVWNTLNQGYNAIPLDPFDISLGVAIPISFDTFLITLVNSSDTEGTIFRSGSVNNINSVNEVLYTQEPQIKAIEVRYDTSNNCIITVLLDDNGEGITSVTAVAITTSEQVETIVDKTPNITPSGNSDNDDIYIFTISNVPPSGLDYISITVVGSGSTAKVDVATLPVEQTVLDDNGILAGSYIIETQVRNQ